jgi:hypothetical protein
MTCGDALITGADVNGQTIAMCGGAKMQNDKDPMP